MTCAGVLVAHLDRPRGFGAEDRKGRGAAHRPDLGLVQLAPRQVRPEDRERALYLVP